MIYDRFGDFEGFTLLTELGVNSRSAAASKRSRTSSIELGSSGPSLPVYVDEHDLWWPKSIVLRRAPGI